MTEAEWLQSTNSQWMLRFLHGRASPRKLRLFACACVRLVWTLVDESGRRAVESIERNPDGRSARHNRVGRRARSARKRTTPGDAAAAAAAAVAAVPDPDPFIAAEDAAYCAWLAAQYDRAAGAASPDEANAAIQAASNECRAAQAALLRDLFVPFWPTAALPDWLGCVDGVRLARAAYDGRDFALLPILADALEESGCADEAVLSHLRVPGPHVRGCWVLDLLLGKE